MYADPLDLVNDENERLRRCRIARVWGRIAPVVVPGWFQAYEPPRDTIYFDRGAVWVSPQNYWRASEAA